jgi:hypothetical protein
MTASSEGTDFSNRYGEQYKDARRVNYRLIDATRELEIYGLTAVAALYAWLFNDGGQHVPRIGYYIAPLFVCWHPLGSSLSCFAPGNSTTTCS